MVKDEEEIGGREAQQEQDHQISMQAVKTNDPPTDLLQRFMNGNYLAHKSSEEEEEEIELSLGLSLHGRFGVDPQRAKKKKLTRSSSIPDFINPVKEIICNNENTSFMVRQPMTGGGNGNLIRTCSLPTETVEDWRKRKELQTLRRMEAKRKRSEKQKNLKIARDSRNRVLGEDNTISGGDDDKRQEVITRINHLENWARFGIPTWVNNGCTIGLKSNGGGGLPPTPPAQQPSPVAAVSHASNGSSQRSASSGISESDGQQQPPGLSKCTEAISPSGVESVSKSEDKSPTSPEAAITEKGVVMKRESNETEVAEKGVKEMAKNLLEDMPCVSTKGDGPNGKRIEGFLYRYRKGEEVRIVCVCHGSFLTPAEFVKHAGGGDVAHPLKHIVVNPSPLL